MMRRRELAAAGASCLALLARAAGAVEATVTQARVEVADRVLKDADGRPVRFKGGVIGAGPAIISFTYTGCASICPVSDLVMNEVEALARARGREDLRLVTLTIDPLNDTPDRLAAHAGAVGGGPRRTWLTGEPSAVYAVLDGLGLRFGSLDSHEMFFLVADGRGRRFLRLGAASADAETLLAAAEGMR